MGYDKAQTFMIDYTPTFSHLMVGAYMDPTDQNNLQSIELISSNFFLMLWSQITF